MGGVMVMVAPVEATYTMVSQFSILQQKYGCFSAVLAVYGQIRAGRCSTRRGGFRKTPRAPLARTRGNEMITRVQRALHTAKNHPSPNHCPSLLASDGCCRTNKASFHAAGAPAAPALRPLAAVARESSSRVEQVSCGERISRCVSTATPHRSHFRTF